MSSTAAVAARDLKKNYGIIEAVRGISFEVMENECYGFLGPNGAGKTTAIRMMFCFTLPTSGELAILGYDVRKDPRLIKALVGVVPQSNSLDMDLNVNENLLVYSRYFGIPKEVAERRADELLEFLSIEHRRTENVESLSGGMQRRLVIARALINEPRVLILDEPTTGLDPQARHLIWQRLRELKRKGVTMILTTHYMEEAEQLCDRVALMDSGRIVAEGSPNQLIAAHVGAEVWQVRGVPSTRLLPLLEGIRFSYEVAGDTVYLYSDDGAGGEHESGKEIGVRLATLKGAIVLHRPANLEDVFFRLTGKDLKD